jgi:hypothetical protein
MPIELSDRDAKLAARLSSRKDRAERHATVLAPIIAEIRAAGVTSLYGITKALNARGVPTATGKGKWQDIGFGGCWRGSSTARLAREPWRAPKQRAAVVQVARWRR